MTRLLAVFFCLLLISACTPAEVPPQLTQTAGPAFTVAEGIYRNDHWQAAYPDGWRVISAAASDRIGVIFVAPDDCTLILLSEAESVPPQPPGCSDETVSEAEIITAGDHTVYVTWVAESARADTVRSTIERVLESIAAV